MLISREEYNLINEAIMGVRNLMTKQDFHKINDEEFTNIIRFLLLQSNADGAGGLFEKRVEIIKDIMVNYDMIDESRFDNIYP